MTANDVLIHSLETSRALLHRYLGDLSPGEYLHRPCPGANCAAWLIGHLILSERRALDRLGASDLPELPAGFEHRFGRENGAPQAETFGDVGILWPLFDRHRDRLIQAVRQATPQRLAQPVEPPHPLFKTESEAIGFIAMHAVMHAGQITIIRRSLGRPPLV